MSTEINGSTIFEAVRTVYANCSAYSDTGDVVSVMIHDQPRPRRRTSSHPFSTWFIRPDRFRDEFATRTIGPPDEWDRYLIWERANETRGWWSIEGEKESRELSLLLAGATGVSGGSARRVPALLMPDRFKKSGPAPAAQLIGVEDVDGVACHKLELSWSPDYLGFSRSETWWTSVETSLLLKEFHIQELGGEHGKRIQELAMQRIKEDPLLGKHLGGAAESLAQITGSEHFRAETTTTFVPNVNETIAESAFEFTPP